MMACAKENFAANFEFSKISRENRQGANSYIKAEENIVIFEEVY